MIFLRILCVLIAGCREVPDEVYNMLETVGGDEKWWEVSAVDFHIFQWSIYRHDRSCMVHWSRRDFIGLVAYLQTVELQKLILAHNDIELLKEDLRNLTSLVVLNLSHNKLTHLPAAIGEYDFFYPFSKYETF